MGERFQKLPKWVRLLMIIIGIVGPATGAVTSAVVAYYKIGEARKGAKAANEKSEAGYQTLAPGIKELQELIKDEQDWSQDADEDLTNLERKAADYEKRITRLETYIEILGASRFLPNAPPKPAKTTQPPDIGPLAIIEDPTMGVRAKLKKAAKKPSRPIPSSVNKAAAYQQQRSDLHCPPKDPQCGRLK